MVFLGVKLNVLFCIFGICSLLVACSIETTKELPEIKKIYVDPSVKKIVNFSDVFTDISIVPLETNDTALVPEIEEVFKVHNRFIIKTERKVFIYTLNGEIISIIDQLGKGPKEHEYISDILINSHENTIEFIDFYNMKLLKFNLDGNYISSFKLPFFIDAFMNCEGDNYYIYTTDPNDQTINKLNLLNIKTKNVTPLNYPIDLHQNEYLNFWRNTVFYGYNNNKYFVINPFDTIYCLGDSITYKYVVDFKGHNIPKNFYKKTYSDILEFSNQVAKHNYSYNIDKFHEIENHLLFKFKQNMSYERVIYNKGSNVAKVIQSFNDDINTTGTIITEHIWPKGGTDKEIIFVFEPLFLKETYSNCNGVLNERLQEIINYIDYGANPVLFIANSR
jgi:hypothetical protein